MKFPIICTSFIMLVLVACSPTRQLSKALSPKIGQSPVFEKSFTGFVLLNPENGEFIYEHQADKFFTPGSNTKIFTLYTCLQILEEKPPVLRYTETDEQLVFWGTGNPTLGYPHFDSDDIVFDFLKNTSKQLFFASGNFKDERYGPGWAWDDYPYYFQPEKAPFPIYGNTVTFRKDSQQNQLTIEPAFFQKMVTPVFNSNENDAPVFRKESGNHFIINAAAIPGKAIFKEIPFQYTEALFLELLNDTLQKNIQYYGKVPLPAKAKTLSGVDIFPIYQRMMQESDNFLAEQLLLMCADKQFGELNSKKMIEFAKDSLLADLPDELLWRDASGLSRYNMFTPRTIARLLEKIYQQTPEEKIFEIFPAGGVNGTIKDWYGSPSAPYIFAKTGTLSGKHCLSGYLKTKTGKTLIFSFMHNNFSGSTQPLKLEMQRILEYIHQTY